MSLRFLVLIAVVASSPANAYCGLGNPSIEQEYRDSAVVLRGRAVSEKSVPKAGATEEGTLYTLSVTEPLKGKVSKTIQVFSENSSGRFPMSSGEQYLVFASSEQGRLSIDNCGNSGVLCGMSNLVFARIVHLALAAGFILTGLAFNALMLRYRDNSSRRLLFGVPLIALLAVIPFVQLDSYSSIAGVRKPLDNDTLFFSVVVFEGLVAIALVFYGAYRRRKPR